MIRREVGDHFRLITQHDHALLSGQLAQQIGNPDFDKPQPYDAVIDGISLHDAGWPLHDDQPTINRNHLPLDVFETTREIGLTVWSESVKRASDAGDYQGLLVSLHVLALSVYATTRTSFSHEKFEQKSLQDRFEINKFQHAQIEIQETLRARLGLRTDLPLKYGLGESGVDANEDQLIFNFRLLQAMDKISLALCCTEPPNKDIEPVHFHVNDKAKTIKVKREGDHLRVHPWPFASVGLKFQIPFRSVPNRAYADDAELRQAYEQTSAEEFGVEITAE